MTARRMDSGRTPEEVLAGAVARLRGDVEDLRGTMLGRLATASVFRNVRAFGAVGDGVADDTAALQATIAAAEASGGILFLPPGIYKTTAPLAITKPFRIIGSAQGPALCEIRNAVSDVVSLTGAGTLSFMHWSNFRLRSQAGGGHCVAQGRAVSRMRMVEVALIQDNDGKSAWHNDGHAYIDNLVFGSELQHKLTATVPTWFMRSSGGDLNSNTWERIRPTFSGDYVWHIESTHAASFAFDNWIRDITFEATTGGCVRMLSARAGGVESAGVYDLHIGTQATKDLFVIDASGSGLASRENVLRNVHRWSTAIGSGVMDIRLGTAKASRVVIDTCTALGDPSVRMHLGSNRSLVLNKHPLADIQAGTFSAIVDAAGHIQAPRDHGFKAFSPDGTAWKLVPPNGGGAAEWESI